MWGPWHRPSVGRTVPHSNTDVSQDFDSTAAGIPGAPSSHHSSHYSHPERHPSLPSPYSSSCPALPGCDTAVPLRSISSRHCRSGGAICDSPQECPGWFSIPPAAQSGAGAVLGVTHIPGDLSVPLPPCPHTDPAERLGSLPWAETVCPPWDVKIPSRFPSPFLSSSPNPISLPFPIPIPVPVPIPIPIPFPIPPLLFFAFPSSLHIKIPFFPCHNLVLLTLPPQQLPLL